MQYPANLQKGDKVCFIAPARKVSPQELKNAISILEAWGLQVVETPNLYLEDHQFAGDDLKRSEHVQWALDHPDIKALFCVRGGYGTSRIIDQLSFDKLKNRLKWLVGFSDITILLSEFFNNGICSLHAPVALLFDQIGNEHAMNSLKEVLFYRQGFMLSAPPIGLNKQGEAKGKLVGGNLSVLVDQIGKFLPDKDLSNPCNMLDMHFFKEIKRFKNPLNFFSQSHLTFTAFFREIL